MSSQGKRQRTPPTRVPIGGGISPQPGATERHGRASASPPAKDARQRERSESTEMPFAYTDQGQAPASRPHAPFPGSGKFHEAFSARLPLSADKASEELSIYGSTNHDRLHAPVRAPHFTLQGTPFAYQQAGWNTQDSFGEVPKRSPSVSSLGELASDLHVRTINPATLLDACTQTLEAVAPPAPVWEQRFMKMHIGEPMQFEPSGADQAEVPLIFEAKFDERQEAWLDQARRSLKVAADFLAEDRLKDPDSDMVVSRPTAPFVPEATHELSRIPSAPISTGRSSHVRRSSAGSYDLLSSSPQRNGTFHIDSAIATGAGVSQPMAHWRRAPQPEMDLPLPVRAQSHVVQVKAPTMATSTLSAFAPHPHTGSPPSVHG